MRRLALLALTLVSTLAAADAGARKQLGQAADALDAARKEARRTGGQCRSQVSNRLEDLSDRVEEMKKTTNPRDVWQVNQDVNAAALAATMAGCSALVQENIQRSLVALEDARIALRGDRRDDRRDDRREGRREDRGDDRRDDGRDAYDEATFAQLQPLTVTPNSVFDGEPAVRVTVPELRLTGLQGQTFYLGVKFRSFEGDWSEWVTTQQWSVPSNPFVWKNAFNHFFRYSALAEEDHARGRFIAHVSVFDAQGRELAFREATFQVRLAQLPPAPVAIDTRPPLLLHPLRDCGTGQDPGCLMQRDGQPAMDTATWQGYLASLRSNASEVMRLDICRTMFRSNYATALQFGAVLDLFNSEVFKMDAARAAAPRLTDPQRAIGFASKFRSSVFARDYTNLMGNQPNPQGPAQAWGPGGTVVVQPVPPQPVPPQPVQPGYGVPPQPVPPQGAYRDCGTGPDQGCTMSRNGQWAMDASTFQGFIASLRSNPNELTRAEVVESITASNGLTALQFGQVLDLFSNELTRMDVARTCAPHVVDPGHAYGFASKWMNGILGREFTQLMAAQR